MTYLFPESWGSTWQSVWESITLASFSIICQHCRREIKRTQFPLQTHGLNLLLSPHTSLKPTHPESSNVMFLFWAYYVKEPFLQVWAKTKRSGQIWRSWFLKPVTQIHLIYGCTLLGLDTFMQTLLLEELSVSGVTLLWNFRDSVKMAWFCNRSQRECVRMFFGECGVSWLLSVFVWSYLERH